MPRRPHPAMLRLNLRKAKSPASIAAGATATAISASRAKAARARRKRAGARSAATAASASRARARIATNGATNSSARIGLSAVTAAAIATRAAGIASPVPRTGNTHRARTRAIAARPIRIRRSPNLRRSRSNWLARTELDKQRLDKWLWHARVVKARTSAAALVESGHVRVNGVRETSPGHAVKAGDVITIALDRGVRLMKVVGFSERRGDATAARVLYEELK